MTKQKKKIYLAIGAIVVALILIVLIILGIIRMFKPKQDAQIGKPEFSKEKDPVITKKIEMLRKEKLYDNVDFEKLKQEQLKEPAKNEEIAEIYFKGVEKPLKFKFFDKEYPELVAQFKENIKKDKYNGKEVAVTERKTIETFDLQDKEPWKEPTVNSYKVLPYYGAIFANGTYDYDQKKELTINFGILFDKNKETDKLKKLGIPAGLIKTFAQTGGNLLLEKNLLAKDLQKVDRETLDRYRVRTEKIEGYNITDYAALPVIGQVYEGMDEIEKTKDKNCVGAGCIKINQIDKIVLTTK